jgi:type I restriction enzyme, S subunit
MTRPMVARVRELSDLVTKGTTPTSIGRAFVSRGINFIKVETITTDGRFIMGKEAHIDAATHAVLRRSQLRAGDILFSIAGALGRSTVVEKSWLPSNTNQAFAIIRPSSRRIGLDSRYLLWQLRSPAILRKISEINVQAAQANLSLEQVRDFEVPIVPLAEQRSIATALDDVDELIAALAQLIAMKQAIKHGMMQQLLTGETRLPGFTDPWRDVLLGNHVRYVRTVALSRAQLNDESPVRYLHYGDIHTRTNPRLDAAHEPMPRASSDLLRNAGRLQQGDLVFADASEDLDGVGKSVEITSVPETGVVPGLHTIAARFDNAVLADGFKAYLQFIPSFRRALRRLAAGTKVLATTRSFVSSITLTLPDVDEQRAIAAVIADGDCEISLLQDRLVKARDVKQGMMQELLSGRTRLPVKEAAA